MKNKLPHLTSVAIIVAAVAVIASQGRSGAAGAPDAVNESVAAPAASIDAAAVASPYDVVKPKNQTVGETLLTHVLAQLERRSSVTAKLKLVANGFGGTGSYWQQGSGEELRVRLELQLPNQDASLLQVSDSRDLWLDRKLPTGRLITRVNLRRLRADPLHSPADLDGPEPGRANWFSTEAGLAAHCGGLPSLIASLMDNFEFLTPQAMNRDEDGDARTPDRLPVYAVVGHWRAEKLAPLLTQFEGNDVAHESSPSPQTTVVRSVPERVPEEVLIVVGQVDFFPRRIEYRKLETPTAGEGTPSIPFQESYAPMTFVEFKNVAFDAPISPGQFDYSSGDTEWTDQTDAILERLRQQRKQVAGRSTPAPK
jgi:hypothetical protein